VGSRLGLVLGRSGEDGQIHCGRHFPFPLASSFALAIGTVRAGRQTQNGRDEPSAQVMSTPARSLLEFFTAVVFWRLGNFGMGKNSWSERICICGVTPHLKSEKAFQLTLRPLSALFLLVIATFAPAESGGRRAVCRMSPGRAVFCPARLMMCL